MAKAIENAGNWETATHPGGWAFATYNDGENQICVFRKTDKEDWFCQSPLLRENAPLDLLPAEFDLAAAKKQAISWLTKNLKHRLQLLPKI